MRDNKAVKRREQKTIFFKKITMKNHTIHSNKWAAAIGIMATWAIMSNVSPFPLWLCLLFGVTCILLHFTPFNKYITVGLFSYAFQKNKKEPMVIK